MSHSDNYVLPDSLPVQEHTNILQMDNTSPSVELTSIKDRVYAVGVELWIQTQGAFKLTLLHSDDGYTFEPLRAWEFSQNVKAELPEDAKRFVRWQIERCNEYPLGVYEVNRVLLLRDQDWWHPA